MESPRTSWRSSHLGHIPVGHPRIGHGHPEPAEQALADGRHGITTRITAQHILGFLAIDRVASKPPIRLLRETLDQDEQMAELDRLSPPAVGPGREAARSGATTAPRFALCERGFHSSARRHGRRLPLPYLLAGVPAYLAHGGKAAAENSFRPGRHQCSPPAPSPAALLPAIPLAAGDSFLLTHGGSPQPSQALE